MKDLLFKEFKLALHPTSIIFLALSAMLLIPNYPYYVTFFYTGLGVFFTCLNGRENNDIFYTASLPVRKKDIVKARILLVVILQILQVIIAAVFALLRQALNMEENLAGMDANIAFFGFAFIMMGLFNLIFFGIYYKNVFKVGKAFLISSIVTFIYIGVAEVCAHAVPFVRDCLDTKDPLYVEYKLAVFILGIVLYIVLTLLSYKRSAKKFEMFDL